MHRLRLRAGIVLAALGSLAALGVTPGCGTDAASTKTDAPPTDTGVDFALQDLDGRLVRLKDLRGRVVVVDFWATWCKPCMAMMPVLEDMQRQLRDRGLTVVFVSIDEAGKEADVRSFIKGYGFTATCLLDPDTAVSDRFNPNRDMPFTMVVGRTGEIAFTRAGHDAGDDADLRRRVEAALAASGTAPVPETLAPAPDEP